MPSSRGSSRPTDGTRISCISCMGGQVGPLPLVPPGKHLLLEFFHHTGGLPALGPRGVGSPEASQRAGPWGSHLPSSRVTVKVTLLVVLEQCHFERTPSELDGSVSQALL